MTFDGPVDILATANDTSGNYTNAGRVVRLVRLVRFVRLYRLILERRRAQQYEEMLQELCDADELDSAEVRASFYCSGNFIIP